MPVGRICTALQYVVCAAGRCGCRQKAEEDLAPLSSPLAWQLSLYLAPQYHHPALPPEILPTANIRAPCSCPSQPSDPLSARQLQSTRACLGVKRGVTQCNQLGCDRVRPTNCERAIIPALRCACGCDICEAACGLQAKEQLSKSQSSVRELDQQNDDLGKGIQGLQKDLESTRTQLSEVR